MAALSDYLESGLLNHIFRDGSFAKPANISVALTSGVNSDSMTGSTIYELPTGINGSGTGYARVDLGTPSSVGDNTWSHVDADIEAGSGVIRNSGQIIFTSALHDWGWVSGVAILDSSTFGSGNMLMHAQLTNPRVIYTGDNVKFDMGTLEISFK
jgi:hypothetical protein